MIIQIGTNSYLGEETAAGHPPIKIRFLWWKLSGESGRWFRNCPDHSLQANESQDLERKYTVPRKNRRSRQVSVL